MMLLHSDSTSYGKLYKQFQSSYQCQISDMIKQDSAMCMVVPACESCCKCTIFLNSCQARALSSLKMNKLCIRKTDKAGTL